MNRRESLKALGITVVSTGVLVEGCKTKDSEPKVKDLSVAKPGRQDFEVERNEKLKNEKFFTDNEMATITILADMIIPKDGKSGSASDAKVPEFIEFIAKDRPEEFEVPLRGGLRWIDLQSFKRYNNPFKDCTKQQQLELVDQIAYPANAKPDMKQGVAFFDKLRGLVATGFFTSKMGVEDLGYVGNRPNRWEGVPQDVIKQYGLENISFDLFRDKKPV